MKLTTRVLIIAVAAVVALGVVLEAAPMKVVVGKVQGKVEVKADDAAAWKVVSDGDMVPVGATVRTGPASGCLLKWAAGNVVEVSALSVLKVSEADSGAGGKENRRGGKGGLVAFCFACILSPLYDAGHSSTRHSRIPPEKPFWSWISRRRPPVSTG